MKRNKKGNEFSDLYKLLTDEKNEFILWGAANIGKKFYNEYSDKLNIIEIVDKDKNKHNEKIGECIVKAPENIEVKDNTIIIVTTSAYYEVSKELNSKGYKKNVNYIDYFLFAKVYELYKNNILISGRVDISMTEKCTLKCKKCNMFMPYFKEPQNVDFQSIKEDVDNYFSVVDYVRDINLLGGEPFLYPDFKKVIEYINENYSDKISRMEIFTNATLLPSKELLEVIKKYNIVVQISDYTNRINYLERINKVKELFDEYEIDYYVLQSEEWGDFGFPENPNDLCDENKLISFFNTCKAPFRGLYYGKVYFCHLETSAIRAGLFEDDENDYFNLKELTEGNKKLFLEFDEGFSDKGYITFCKKCRGCSCVNDMTVKSALQFE